MSSQLDRWKGTFGDEYVKRNVVDPQTRSEWFGSHIPRDVQSVLEVGANASHNLIAIGLSRPEIWTQGTEPNASARMRALESGIHLAPYDIYTMKPQVQFDLVFTSGVLIHVPPKRLDYALSNLYDASGKYLLAIEYRRDEDTAIEYRGYQDMLWAGDYGAHYQRLFPSLELIGEGELTAAVGFNDAYYWLLRKGTV